MSCEGITEIDLVSLVSHGHLDSHRRAPPLLPSCMQSVPLMTMALPVFCYTKTMPGRSRSLGCTFVGRAGMQVSLQLGNTQEHHMT